MELFDACCALGPAPRLPLAQEDAPSLLAEMDRLGVARALVYHTLAAAHAPDDGNARLMEAIAGQPRLEPCWVLLPGEGSARPGAEAPLCDAMGGQGVRAVRIYPRDHGYPLAEWMAGPLLAALGDRSYLVSLDLDQVLFPSAVYDLNQSTWRDVVWLCQTYPGLSVLLTRVGYRSLRALLPLLRACPNLHLDTSYFATHLGVEEVAAQVGAGRLLFASGQPYVDGGGAIARLRYAELTDGQATQIASANLERLLDRVASRAAARERARLTHQPSLSPSATTPPSPPGSRRASPPTERLVHAGRPLSEAGLEIIDAHGHLGPYRNFAIPDPGADAMVRLMDRCGVARLGISSHLAIGAEWITGNRMTADAVARHPDRLFGYAVPDPHQPGRIREELTHCFDRLGMVALKLHPDLAELPIGDPGYGPAWEFAAERGCLVLAHTFHASRFCDPSALRPLAERYPGLPILLVHSGAQTAAFPGAIALARACPNVYLDLSGSFITGPWIAALVREAGADRVVWSSDIPFIDLRYGLGRAAFARLDPEALRLVMGGNIKRLLGSNGG
jgi:predicted TIM-barrel fold metal-dependent hydrolase